MDCYTIVFESHLQKISDAIVSTEQNILLTVQIADGLSKE